MSDKFKINVVDSENEESIINIFAECVDIAVHYMVCMEDVKSITKIVRTRDYARWKGIDENNLNQLRKEKEGIDEEHFLSLFHNEV